jgi:hypothetical protein
VSSRRKRGHALRRNRLFDEGGVKSGEGLRSGECGAMNVEIDERKGVAGAKTAACVALAFAGEGRKGRLDDIGARRFRPDALACSIITMTRSDKSGTLTRMRDDVEQAKGT